MIHAFRTSDALRCILLNAPRGQNLACPMRSVSTSWLPHTAKLWQETLAQRPNRITLGWWDRMQVAGLVSAAHRRGPSVWEIEHLYLPEVGAKHAVPLRGDTREMHPNGNGLGDAPDAACLDLLEQMVQLVGQRQAQRIFLRMASGSPLIDLVRRVGFFPYFEETSLRRDVISSGLDRGRGGRISPAKSEPWEIVSQESCTPQDEYSLFHLYSAATPSQVRVALGHTFDQWRDARGHHGRGVLTLPGRGLGRIFSIRPSEWVASSNGKIIGWLSLHPHRGVVGGEVMVHPDHLGLLPALMDLALASRGPQRWLVPDYQVAVGDLLRGHGFKEDGYYTVLVKTVAARIPSHGMVPAEA